MDRTERARERRKADRAKVFGTPVGLPQLKRRRPNVLKQGIPCLKTSEDFVEYTKERGWNARRVFASPRVDDATYAARMSSCRACDHSTIYADGVMHCACATCREWVGKGGTADLRQRNRHSGNRCPA